MTKHSAHVLAYKKAVAAGLLGKAAECLYRWKLQTEANKPAGN